MEIHVGFPLNGIHRKLIPKGYFSASHRLAYRIFKFENGKFIPNKYNKKRIKYKLILYSGGK